VQRLVRRIDAMQRSNGAFAFAFAVVKKFGDDTAGNLAALVTYYGFLSLFPLLLVLVTVLGIIAGGDPSLARSIERSALSEFPVIGTELAKNIHALRRDSPASLAIGLVGLIWGARGAVQVGQEAMADVWNVPEPERPSFVPRLLRSFSMLAVLAVFLVASTAVSGFTSFDRTVTAIATAGSVVLTLVLNVVLYLLAFRILTPKVVERRHLVLGSVVGGVAWTILQYGGTLLVDHELRGSNELYGFFGIVLGLLAWIFLGAEATMYAAEISVVRARRLWPRSMVHPPLTDADKKVYAAVTMQQRRRPEQRVDVAFEVPSPEAPRRAAHARRTPSREAPSREAPSREAPSPGEQHPPG
jgi:YihY family inner membrane protein